MSSQSQNVHSSGMTEPSHLIFVPKESSKNQFPALLNDILDIVSGNLVERFDNNADYRYQKEAILKKINIEALQTCPPKNGEELWKQFVYVVSTMEMSRRKIQSKSDTYVSYNKKWRCCSQCQYPSKKRFCDNCKKSRLKPIQANKMLFSKKCPTCSLKVYLCICKEVGLETGQYL